MRIGLNLLYLLPGIVGGTETYAAGLLSGLAAIDSHDDFFVFVNRESANWPLPQVPNFRQVVCPVSATSRWRRYVFEQFQLPYLLKAHHISVVHSLGYVSPLVTPCPAVVTVPDLNYQAFGDQMPTIRRLALSFFVSQSVRRTCRVLTISRFAQRQIAQAFKLPTVRVMVTHLAPKSAGYAQFDTVKTDALIEKLRITPPYGLAFSSRSPNKNVPRLLQAFAQAQKTYGVPHQLVLIGHPPDDNLSVLAHDVRLHFTDYLDDGALQTVLSQAQFLVFPSLYEGFGLPVLEAMAMGVPVVCSTAASLPEVAGEAALYFDPYSVNDMAQQIARVALDSGLRDVLRQKGRENAKRFSWTKTAAETLAVYRQLYRTRRPS